MPMLNSILVMVQPVLWLASRISSRSEPSVLTSSFAVMTVRMFLTMIVALPVSALFAVSVMVSVCTHGAWAIAVAQLAASEVGGVKAYSLAAQNEPSFGSSAMPL